MVYARTWKKNQRKAAILGVLAVARDSLTYAQVGGAIGLYPLKQVATALTKYTRWGYVRRWKAAGRFRYELTNRGRERLVFFNRSAPKLHREVHRKSH